MHICFLIKKKKEEQGMKIKGLVEKTKTYLQLTYAQSSLNYVETDLLIPVNKQLIRT